MKKCTKHKIQNDKKNGRKFCVYIQTFYVRSEVFGKKENLMWPLNTHIGASKFVFFTQDTKNVLFARKLMANIECPDVREIFFEFFYIWKFVFKQWVHMHP
jgi:hypothetical protein